MNKLTLLLPVFALSMTVAASTAMQVPHELDGSKGPKRIVPVLHEVDDDVVLHIPGTDGKFMRVGDLKKKNVKKTPAAVKEMSSSLREDFDKFTGGSESYPDVNTVIVSADGYIDSQYTVSEGWRGDEVYMAGGACYLRYNPSTYTGGYIQTPGINLTKDEGSFTVTFRARNYDSEDPAYLTLEHSQTGNFFAATDMKEVALTDEYKEYTFTFTTGAASSVVRLSMFYGGGAFIDYIDILQEGEGLPAPHVNPASNVSQTGFTASWAQVPGATSYKLNLWHKVIDPDNSVVETRVEDFSGLVTVDDNFCNVIPNRNGEMFAIDGVGEGWEVGVAKAGNHRHYYSDPEYCQSLPNSMCFDADYDYIFTPENNEKEVSHFEFWIKSEVLDTSDKLYILFNLNTSDEITTADAIYMYTLSDYAEDGILDEGIIFEIPFDYIPENVNKVHVQWGGVIGQPCQGYAAVDDITVKYGVDVPTLVVNDYEDLEVTGTSHTFTDLEKDGTYYYTVTAVDADGNESIASTEQSVRLTFYSLDAPVAYEVTEPMVEVDDAGNVYESFYANWDAVENAQGYELSLDLIHMAQKDEVYKLDEEDFSGIPSQADPSNPDLFTAASLDMSSYCNRAGWSLSMPVLASGIMGAQNGIFSPRFDLSNAGGAYTVDLTFYGQVGDVITVAAYDYSGVANNATQQCTLTSQTESFTLEFANGTEEMGFTITSTGYYVMLDDFVLAQALKQGDETRMTYYSGRQEGYFDRALTYVVNRQLGDTYLYKVRAFAENANGSSILSPYSNEVFIDLGDLPYDSVDEGANVNNAKVYVANDELVVEVSEDVTVDVFSVNGVKLDSFDAVMGVNRAELPQGGVYVVKVGNEVFKVVK